MKSGNGIPARCVYLEEMAADLDEQDWLDMENVEQVSPCVDLLVLFRLVLTVQNHGRCNEYKQCPMKNSLKTPTLNNLIISL